MFSGQGLKAWQLLHEGLIYDNLDPFFNNVQLAIVDKTATIYYPCEVQIEHNYYKYGRHPSDGRKTEI